MRYYFLTVFVLLSYSFNCFSNKNWVEGKWGIESVVKDADTLFLYDDFDYSLKYNLKLNENVNSEYDSLEVAKEAYERFKHTNNTYWHFLGNKFTARSPTRHGRVNDNLDSGNYIMFDETIILTYLSRNYMQIQLMIDKASNKLYLLDNINGVEIRTNLRKIEEENVQEDCMKSIRSIFENYIQHEESVDSEDNKNTLMNCLKSMGEINSLEELELLINIWMYYDLTDVDIRGPVAKFLSKTPELSSRAVKTRIKNKKEWEKEGGAPFSELDLLLKQLDKSNPTN